MKVIVAPGDAVLTKFGAGVVVRCSSSLGDKDGGVDGGDGPGEGEGCNDERPMWASIRLWRQPGKSIASCSMATLRVDDENVVIKKLVAAPGMIVRAHESMEGRDDNAAVGDEDNDQQRPTKLYLIERYLPTEHIFLASSIDNGDGDDNSGVSKSKPKCQLAKKYHQLTPQQIVPSSTSAKFYPILEDLIGRGEKAWNVAVEKTKKSSPELAENISKVTDRLSSAVTVTTASNGDATTGGVAKIISNTSKSSVQAINEKLANTSLENGQATASAAATNIAQAATEGLPSLPQADEVKHIYEMLRDDDLTALFHRGKSRLKELVEVEIPTKTKQTLGKIGIELEDEENKGGNKSIRGQMDKLRKEALASLDEMLKTNVTTDENGNVVINANAMNNGASIQVDTKNILDPSLFPTSTDARELSHQAQHQFAAVFDHLSKVASSDPQLLQIFSGISEKTKLWQEMTGRILQTKTASLFMEGSQRLKARAAEVLTAGTGNIRDALGSGANADLTHLTRAFTEGDVAKTKLKSMEMGDAIRKRLFNAIELRSESSGGLDAIIAGSLNKIHDTGDTYSFKAANVAGLLGDKRMKDLSVSSDGISEDSIQSVITNLQQSATSSMKGTKETLIALLSRRSGCRDAVLLRLEQVFLDLESQLGQDLTPEQIANLANGEGGSLALFQPIAMKAAKEIETQLDAAEQKMKESKHWNPQADGVMGKVRQITSGELSMMDVLDMAAGYLDDDNVVAKSGGLIVKAENFLDDFEAASARLGDAGNTANRAGGDAGVGIMDAVAKLGYTKDTVMKGVEGLDVNKLLDDTQSAMTDEVARRELISSAGDTALDFLLKILPSMPVPPFDGVREGLVYHLSNLSLAGFKVKKEDVYIEIAGIRAAAQNADGSSIPQSTRAVKASELLIIDIRNISATLDDAVWRFEQTYMPYLKGSGKANTRLWDGAIRMKFELRRRRKDDTDEWEPVLCLNDRSCSIGGVELTIQGEGRITWVANKLASLLGSKLRDYVVSVIITALTNNSGWLIDMLNSNLSNYWDFVMRTANLELDKLPKLARHHVTKAEVDEKEDEVELVWRERVPLGLNILTNDESGYLKVIDLPRGTQARKVAQSKQLDPDIFKGSTIVSVNGRRYGPDTQVELFAALKDPARPKAILFKLANKDDLDRMEKIVGQSRGTSSASNNDQKPANNKRKEGKDIITVVDIVDAGDIGLKFITHDNFALAVSDFIRDSSSGRQLPLERTGKVMIGDLLSHINGTLVLGEKGEGKHKALSLFEQVGSQRPLSLGFVKPYLYNIVLEKNDPENESFGGPSELVFTEVKTSASTENKIVLKEFAPAEGAAETGDVFVGDQLVFINGIPIGAGCRVLQNSDPSPKLDEVIRMLKRYTPLVLTFARAQANQTATVKTYLTSSPLSLDVESAYTFAIPASDYSHLGCRFVTGMNGSDIVVKDISGVDGPFQRQMKASKQTFLGCKLESVDGEVVPSYVNSQLTVNAMKRRWTANGRVELTFCNDMHRYAIRKLGSLDNANN